MLPRNHERELPFLAGIAGLFRWLEELANILSGPLLTAGLAIALIDLLTDGALLSAQPALLYGWAISQAVGVDAQLVAAWDKARQALRARRWWTLAGLLILGAALAYVAWIAAEVFSLQQAEGLTTMQALGRLGMDNATWLVSRAALSVVLVCLSGWTRYHAPAQTSIEDERAKLERELTLEPLRAQVRMRKAVGWRDLGRSIVQGETAPATVALPTHAQDASQSPALPPAPDAIVSREEAASATTNAHSVPPKPPTGPGSPSVAPRPVRTHRERSPAVLKLEPPEEWRESRRTAAQARSKGSNTRRVRTASVEEMVRAAWRPGMSVSQLQRAADVSRNAAGKYRRILVAEAEGQAAQ